MKSYFQMTPEEREEYKKQVAERMAQYQNEDWVTVFGPSGATLTIPRSIYEKEQEREKARKQQVWEKKLQATREWVERTRKKANPLMTDEQAEEWIRMLSPKSPNETPLEKGQRVQALKAFVKQFPWSVTEESNQE